MARLLFCRFEDCREAYVSDAGKMPSVCPACGRTAHWTTERPAGLPPPRSLDDPATPYRLSENDRRFLTRLRVRVD